MLPEGVAVGPDGNVYVAEAGSTHRASRCGPPTGASCAASATTAAARASSTIPRQRGRRRRRLRVRGRQRQQPRRALHAGRAVHRVDRPGLSLQRGARPGVRPGEGSRSPPTARCSSPTSSSAASSATRPRAPSWAASDRRAAATASSQATAGIAAAPAQRSTSPTGASRACSASRRPGLRRAGRQRRGQRPRPVLASVLPRGRLPRDALRRRRRQQPHPAPRRAGRARRAATPRRTGERLALTATARTPQRFRTHLRRGGGRGVRPPVHGEGERHGQGRRAPPRAAPRARSPSRWTGRRPADRPRRALGARHRSRAGRPAPPSPDGGDPARHGDSTCAGSGARSRAACAALARQRDATVTWIARGSRTQAIMPRAVRRSSTNWKASAWARLR